MPLSLGVCAWHSTLPKKWIRVKIVEWGDSRSTLLGTIEEAEQGAAKRGNIENQALASDIGPKAATKVLSLFEGGSFQRSIGV
jgi:hypothetical protein